MFKRALVSTSDKTGLISFIKPLSEAGCEIVSTGGTSQFLRENGIKVKEVAEVTGFPEVMDGRVRTLHPKIHMALLARSYEASDTKLLNEHNIKPFDLVVVNLYPFAEAVKKGLKGKELIEEIDIGGPTLLRSASKSFERITVVCDPKDYDQVLDYAKNNKIDAGFRQELAAKVFSHCSHYDALISHTLSFSTEEKIQNTLPEKIIMQWELHQPLRYGENPQQSAGFYKTGIIDKLSLHQAEQIQGKELSYNNIMDLEAAVSVICEFENPTAVIIKHNTPCGVAEGENIYSAYKRAFEADSVSAFGGIVALNHELDEELAQTMVVTFLECIIAPDITPEALKIFSAKKNLRLLRLPALKNPTLSQELEFKSLRGGVLVQTPDMKVKWSNEWKAVGASPSEKIKQDLVFAQRIVKHVKSNGIVLASGLQTQGVCGGQTNRVDSVLMAIERAKKRGVRGEECVLGSDAFFPFRDSVDLAAQFGVKWIIQPGGSQRDQEVEEAVEEKKMGMILTGVRHFKH